MKPKLIDSSIETLPNYEGTREIYIYKCPCGKGPIVEEHDNIPGCRDHDVYFRCKECEQKYEFDLTNGIRNWKLIKKKETNNV